MVNLAEGGFGEFVTRGKFLFETGHGFERVGPA